MTTVHSQRTHLCAVDGSYTVGHEDGQHRGRGWRAVDQRSHALHAVVSHGQRAQHGKVVGDRFAAARAGRAW